ncbi:DUF599 family protein [Rhizobium sp. BK376]|uniref:DUF599 domain-containing protein n=1 Tax=Rhizobium sp. BK376 TaxID=2512149 RepID=UPI0010466F7D|nr:DUF599 family protein [Rhizobium sp. BK376]TCR85280.1 putative membrane protein [Rhizobium sp. BK376]
MATLDIVAFVVFVIFWLGLEPLMGGLWPGSNGIVVDMRTVRRAWMREVLTRDNNFIGDAAIIGHVINSASFFGSANLLILVGLGGTLFVDPPVAVENGLILAMTTPVPTWLVHAKVLLVLATLTRGLSDFIWAVRQLNYCLAAIGASPSRSEERDIDAWTDALAAVLNPALRTFSAGVRSYYFTFAAAAWIFGPTAFLVGTLFSSCLLFWRQTYSDTAKGVKAIKRLLDAQEDTR